LAAKKFKLWCVCVFDVKSGDLFGSEDAVAQGADWYSDAGAKKEGAMLKGILDIFKTKQHNGRKSSNLIFKSSVDAFNYAEKYFYIPSQFDFNEVYLGLVMSAEGKDVVLLAHRQSESGSVVANKVVAVAGDGLELAKLDLVIWKCNASMLGRNFGTVLTKLSLELDLESGEFKQDGC
jgi:hypothetical protein